MCTELESLAPGCPRPSHDEAGKRARGPPEPEINTACSCSGYCKTFPLLAKRDPGVVRARTLKLKRTRIE